jgi:hypothetical protein
MNVDPLFQAAWETGVPFALDRVAEQLARAGSSKSVLYDSLERLLFKARDEGADDDSEERILGVMDRLTGWCDPDSRIVTTSPIQNGHAHPSVPAVATR